MAKSRRITNRGKGRQRRISVRAVRREPPDIARLGRAVVALALAAQAEADAQAEAEAKGKERPITTVQPRAGEQAETRPQRSDDD